jgi:hypothetical protein
MFTSLVYRCRRKNYVHAAYVYAAQYLLNAGSSREALSMLRNFRISEEVIARVLFSDGPVRKRGAVAMDQYASALDLK